ncbi:helix-turn-helix domain-containing protein [uncultured Clostridium sp.]|uniref:helix-turn-helix domain-containing protein n=1 Tax=uncultured Clostridium sp. TaxID=59620 RepID=UPI0025F5FDBB|nr:helix-turn-helix transcriptional regulator [uncultured Clostridium sp.]
MGINEIIKVGNNIKRIRKQKNISQKDMAKKLNMPSSTYSNYENNNREPNAATLRKIADILNVDISDLLNLNSPENESSEKYLSDDINTIHVIEDLIKLCEFNINFNKLSSDDRELESSLKLAIKNNTIPLTYISNGHDNLDLTNAEFMKFTDKILRFVKFEVNELISNKSS